MKLFIVPLNLGAWLAQQTPEIGTPQKSALDMACDDVGTLEAQLERALRAIAELREQLERTQFARARADHESPRPQMGAAKAGDAIVVAQLRAEGVTAREVAEGWKKRAEGAERRAEIAERELGIKETRLCNANERNAELSALLHAHTHGADSAKPVALPPDVEAAFAAHCARHPNSWHARLDFVAGVQFGRATPDDDDLRFPTYAEAQRAAMRAEPLTEPGEPE